MALENKMKVNIDSLRADPLLIKDHEDNSFAILDDSLDSKLVDIATLKAYDKALRGTELGETFDTLKEIQVRIKEEESRAVAAENEIASNLITESNRAKAEETTLKNSKLDKSIYEDYIKDRAMTDSALKEDASSKASQTLKEAKEYTDKALEKWQFSTATEVDIEDLFKENN